MQWWAGAGLSSLLPCPFAAGTDFAGIPQLVIFSAPWLPLGSSAWCRGCKNTVWGEHHMAPSSTSILNKASPCFVWWSQQPGRAPGVKKAHSFKPGRTPVSAAAWQAQGPYSAGGPRKHSAILTTRARQQRQQQATGK
jgi:hypothetical protein